MRAPSYRGLTPASDASSRAMQGNRAEDTGPERRLRQKLWRLGLRYRKNVRSLPGKPDVVFSRARVTVFCDGDFWHGRDWGVLKKKLLRRANAGYWTAKIATNMDRDSRHTHELQKLGWEVIRVWETDINSDPACVAEKIQRVVAERTPKPYGRGAGGRP